MYKICYIKKTNNGDTMQIIKTNLKLIILLFIMFTISLVTLYNADKINQSVDDIVIKQAIWIFIGIFSMVFICFIKNDFIIKNIKYLYVIFNILLFLLLIFGTKINNAKCWFKIPHIGTFQPSEFMKVILIIIISKEIVKFRKKRKEKNFHNDFLLFSMTFLILLIPSVLTFLEPDTGAILMYFMPVICILFINGFDKKWWIIFLLTIFIVIGSTIYLYYFNQNLFLKLLGNSFYLRVERILNWVNLEGLQLNNSIISIGNAGLLGNFSNEVYFPEAHTDFIFSVFSSNFGFIGSLFLIVVIIIFDLELLNISYKSKSKINKYIVIGFLGLLLYQQIQNISMTIGLLPITGITLPFISYGGSSLINYMIIMGIVFNINYENHKYKN